MASQTSKESLAGEGGGKESFLREDDRVILKKTPTFQTPRHTIKEKGQRKSKKGR